MKRLILVLGLLAAAGCGGDDGGTKTPQFKTIFEDLPGALISIHGTAADDIWTVGGDQGDGLGPTVLHFDGTAWERKATGLTVGDLWWVHAFEDGVTYIGGAGGVILRAKGNKMTAMTTPGTNTVFGIWGPASDDVWAVGGAEGGTSGAFAWHYDGHAWVDVALPGGLQGSAVLFKVWGRASNDVWLVGSAGTILHWNGDDFEVQDSGDSDRPLYTVHADKDRVVAVGGFGNASVIENDGSGWREVAPEFAPGAIGVWLTGDGGGYASGTNGSILRRAKNGEWSQLDIDNPNTEALHAIFVDPAGGIWSVGGEVLSYPLVKGTLLYAGSAAVPTTINDP